MKPTHLQADQAVDMQALLSIAPVRSFFDTSARNSPTKNSVSGKWGEETQLWRRSHENEHQSLNAHVLVFR